jgi:hypothetical protein
MTATIIKSMMSLAAEAELGALFIHAKEAVHICNILTKMGHLQQHTPIQMDNTTPKGVINNWSNQNGSKPWTWPYTG